MKKIVFKILVFLSLFIFSDALKANYWLVIGTYRQGAGSRPEVGGITKPSLDTIQKNNVQTCEKADNKIFNEIYRPVW